MQKLSIILGRSFPLLCGALALCAQAQGADDPIVSVRFEDVETIPFVEIRLQDSRPLAFILDTGSTRMLVDQKVARSLGLKEEEPDSVSGAGAGRIAIRKIHDLSIAIKDFRSEHYEFGSIDFSSVSAVLGRQVDGILGYEFLSRFVVTLDYDRKILTLRSPEAQPPAPGVEIPITIEKRWPFVEARLVVRGAPPQTDKFLIDSGSSDAVDHPVAADPRIQKRATATGIGLGAPGQGYITQADEMEIGPYKLRDLTLVSGGASAAVSKLIGSAVLSKFTVTYDYPRSRIFLAERSESVVEKR